MPSLAPPDGLHTNSAEFCGACHIDIYQEWAGSMMGQSFTDPVFQAEWHHGEEFQWCLNCHAPLQNQQPLIVDGVSTLRPPTVSGTPNPDFDPALQAEGVTCVVCHQEESAIRAPHADVQAPHAVVHDPTLSSPESCENCHQMTILPFTKVKRPLTDSHNEWEEWKAQTGRTEDCLDCHMPAITRPVVPGGVPREGRMHTFPGAWNDQMVQSALQVVPPERVGDTIQVQIENLAGHRFPSGEPARVLFVRLDIQNTSDQSIYNAEERIERRVEGPGARERYDTTLAPAERRTVTFDVPPEIAPMAATARVELVFDRYGNLDALIDELEPLNLPREIRLADHELAW